MRVLTAAVLATCLLACAAPQPSTLIPVQSPDMVTVATSDGSTTDVRIVREDFVARRELLAPRAKVWAAVPGVYREVGLPAPKLDQTQTIALVENHAISGMLGKERLSKLLSCGSGISGEYADTRRIRLTVRTTLESVGPDKTAVLTQVEAVATSMDGASAAPIRCTSKGPLEASIASRLREHAGGAP